MAFKYKFSTLLNVRKIKENIAQQAFSQSQRYLKSLVSMRDQVLAKRDLLRAELMTRMSQGLSATEVKIYYDYLLYLEKGVARIEENIKTAEQQVDVKREELLKAKRDSKAILRLKEIHQARYDDALKKKDMIFLDEIAVLRHGGEK